MNTHTRIGYLRDLIISHNGSADVRCFCDEPRSSFGPKLGNLVKYIIINQTDGLSVMQRRAIAAAMNIPENYAQRTMGVHHAYVNRGGHLVVVFNREQPTHSPKPNVDPGTKMSDNVFTVTHSENTMEHDWFVNTKTGKAYTASEVFYREFCSDEAIDIMAKNVIEEMAESVSMMNEDDPSCGMPSNNEISEMTIDYFKELVGEFQVGTIKRIRELMSKSPIKFDTVRTIKTTIKFD